MKSLTIFICIFLIFATVSAHSIEKVNDYDWKACANSIINTLQLALTCIQEAINGQYVKLSVDMAKLTASVPVCVTQCGQNPTYQLNINQQALAQCQVVLEGSISQLVKYTLPNVDFETMNYMTMLPLLGELQKIYSECSAVFVSGQ